MMGNIVLDPSMTWGDLLIERLNTRAQLEDQLDWPISDQTKAVIEARLAEIDDEVIVVESLIERYGGNNECKA